jgi:hypothetical protein
MKPLVYAGITVSEKEVLELIPEAIVKPPAKQSDIISDVIELDPTHLFLIDGRFHQVLPVWPKELVYALMHPSLEGRVYGASSMGAIRAADVAAHGMIGYGKIFNWYYESVITDDSEVAVAYYVAQDGSCVQSTVALVDVRATIETLEPAVDPELLFLEAKRIHWTRRTKQTVLSKWKKIGFEFDGEFVEQKKIDAIGLLTNYKDLPVTGPIGVGPSSLTHLFMAQFERERRVGEKKIGLEEIDAHVALTNPYGRRIFEDANNRSLALILCDHMQIGCTTDERDYELAEFCTLNRISDVESLSKWKTDNACSSAELEILMVQRARLKKLHRSLRTSRQTRYATADVLSYLRSCDRLAPFINQVSVIDWPEDEQIESDDVALWKMLEQQAASRNIPLVANEEAFALDLGFGDTTNLRSALEKYRRLDLRSGS